MDFQYLQWSKTTSKSSKFKLTGVKDIQSFLSFANFYCHFTFNYLKIKTKDKIQVIQDWPEPCKVKDVQAFLGSANFYPLCF